MLKKKDTVINEQGLEIEVEIFYIEQVKEWCMDSYNTAKLLVYKELSSLLPKEEEEKRIAMILNSDVEKVLSQKFPHNGTSR